MTGKTIPRRRGITLVELLVVVGILMILVTLVVPGLMPTMESRRVREAARAVNVFLSTQRVRALDSGHITGVMLVRDESLPNACTVLRQIEMPPLYAGDYGNTAVRLQLTGATSTTFLVRAQVGIVSSNGFVAGSYIRRVMIEGGSIRINQQGPWCPIGTITGTANVSEFTFFVPRNSQSAVPWSASQLSQPQPFEIMRLPEPSATNQIQLPESVCIDLAFSGMDFQVLGFPQPPNPPAAPKYPVNILFSPNGSVLMVMYNNFRFVPTTPVYLLVGRRERVAAPAAADDPIQHNWQDMNNLWVSLNPRTGTVTSAEPAGHYELNSQGAPIPTGEPPYTVLESRNFAREAQKIGGR